MRYLRPLQIFALLTITLQTLSLPVIYADQEPFDSHLNKPTVVIDPGHGGEEAGASGPDNTLEKNITLFIAKQIKKGLSSSCNVILTRTDDYWVNTGNRTEIANGAKANLFISLHTGGSFIHETSGIDFIFYKPPEGTGDDSSDSPTEQTGALKKTMWGSAQTKYTPISKWFANSLYKQFSLTPKYGTSRVSGLPATVLSGANMPAVIIETGYITNPTQEKLLKNPDFLSDFANDICTGVNRFFDKHENTY